MLPKLCWLSNVDGNLHFAADGSRKKKTAESPKAVRSNTFGTYDKENSALNLSFNCPLTEANRATSLSVQFSAAG